MEGIWLIDEQYYSIAHIWDKYRHLAVLPHIFHQYIAQGGAHVLDKYCYPTDESHVRSHVRSHAKISSDHFR